MHVVVEHGEDGRPYGCAYIRDLLPLGHPSNGGAFAVTSDIVDRPADIVVVERTWHPSVTLAETEALIERVRARGSCLVYSLDDNLLDLRGLPEETRSVVRLFCREADGVVVATGALAERLQRLSRQVRVVPNALDERLFFADEDVPAPRPRSECKVIGYMGTFTHDRDLMTILQPLREILRLAKGGVELQIVGAFANRNLIRAFDGFPATLLQVPAADVEYPRFVAWMRRNLSWDLAVAPVEGTPFNRYKSDIKFLDYGALGVAGVYSAAPCYVSTVRHGRTGYLTDNTPTAWVEGLSLLLGDDERRRTLAAGARDYVRSRRTLAVCAGAWREALLAIRSGAGELRGSEPAPSTATPERPAPR